MGSNESRGGAGRPLTSDDLRAWIRDVPDFPKPGILFKDITPLLAQPHAFQAAIDLMAGAIEKHEPDLLAGIEARGFMFASALSLRLGIGFAPVRKPGKLPYRAIGESYELEYGSDSLWIHEDAFARGARVAVVDDLLATGGTASAVGRLIEKLGGQVVAFSFLVELGFLKGRSNLGDRPVHGVITY